ncbi:MAG: hypothetical protein KBD06_01705 [Candidatus Pacebacteria bacterium]|nr:hypothetical protein [Candidatus Paceibacterota bacterium]
MAHVAAVLAALTVFLWVLGIVLMSTSYEQTGVLMTGLGFITGTGHAFVRRCEASQSSPEIPASTQEEERDMRNETQSQQFFGIVAMAIALAIAVAVGIYFTQVFWRDTTPDLGLTAGGVAIPAETYPIILLSFWTLSQRGMSTWRPQEGTVGKWAWWIDLLSSAGLFAFLLYTMVSAMMGGTAHTSFMIILAAFVVQGFGDLVLNGRHYYGSTGGPAGDLLNGILTGNAAVGPYEVRPKVVLRPEYVVIQPDGSERTVEPELITGPAGS